MPTATTSRAAPTRATPSASSWSRPTAARIRLALDGTLTVQRLGEPERPHDYVHDRRGFAGDCVLATQQHFVDRLRSGPPFETEGTAYLRTLVVVESLYESARLRIPVEVPPGDHHDPTVTL